MMIVFIKLAVIMTLLFGLVASRDIDALLSGMTLSEKVGQMTQIDIAVFYNETSKTIDYEKLGNWIEEYKIGSILNSINSGGDVGTSVGWTATEWRKFIHQMQSFAMSNTKSQIPLIYGIDSIHGATYVYGAALFPQSIALAATFDNTLSYKAGAITSKDTRAAGISWIFAPVLGLALQPLWARFEETFGEDPFLAAQMGSSMIRGLQDVTSDGGIPTRTAACMKHFIAYSDPEDGHDRSPVQLPDRVMQQLYRPAFQAAIDAGVMSAMESYQEVGGVPMASSSQYLKTLLRSPTQMNFTGMMVTDYHEIANLYDFHKIAESPKDAVRIAMQETEIDMSMVPTDADFVGYLIELVNEGTIPTSRIDRSVRRILELKQKLGMFNALVPTTDDPLVRTVGSAQDWAASLAASRDVMTLLKNTNNLLPLAQTAKVLLTGPTCDSLVSQSGGWTYHWQGALNDNEFTNGSTIRNGMIDMGIFPNAVFMQGPGINDADLSNVDVAAVMAQAAASDVIVACIGEGAYAEKPGDIDDLSLASGQVQYVSQLASSGKPVVLVIVSGRPRLLNGAAEQAAAVLETFVPGPMAGQAVAEVLAGFYSPSGRMPFTYPKNAGDSPYPYHRKPSDQCRDGACQVEWAFGQGMSYSTFEYSDFKFVGSNEMDETEQVLMSVVVKNTGDMPAKHSALLFAFDMVRRVTPEYKLLKGFTKFSVAPHDEVTVPFVLKASDLQYVGVDSRYILEDGVFMLAVGPDVDCRVDNSSCLELYLGLSAQYHPVCDVACGMWERGVCGAFPAGTVSCRDTCIAQKWSWNYVDCLEAATEGTCSGPLQCYSAFATTITPDSVPSADSANSVSQSTFTWVTIVVGLSCAAVSMLLTWMHFHFTYVAPSNSDIAHGKRDSDGADNSLLKTERDDV